MFAQQHGLEAEAVKAVTADTLRWENLRYKHISSLRPKLAQVYKPATVNKCLSALKGVLKTAWFQNQIDTDSYMRAIALERIKGSSLPAGRALSTDEVAALFATCVADRSPAGTRDAAAFSLMYGAGLRRSETVDLKVEDYDPAIGKIRITGKGNKERQVYAINGVAEAVGAWLAHRGTAPGPLLHPVNKAGNISHGATITS